MVGKDTCKELLCCNSISRKRQRCGDSSVSYQTMAYTIRGKRLYREILVGIVQCHINTLSRYAAIV